MALRLSEEEYNALMARRGGGEITQATEKKITPRNKYGNRRVEVDGIKFDSIHEADVYRDLMMRVKAGELKCVCRQVKFDLGGGRNAGKDSRYQYIADFVTIDQENRVDVLDAKSEITRKNRTYINKKKQILAEWGIAIREV